ncbi:MAG: Gfo/Idh/MocA family oxidoreductase [Chloroflexi bacterium]|nr:Gfo/Idh/MocA family oxidoreductase [Chloroflexota bacterium]
MKQPEPLRIGLVGCGMHGINLAHALIRSTGLRLVSCADPDTDAAERAASLAGDVHTYPSIDALLDSCDVDAVMIATPHDVLAPAALSALRAGKHVLLEKPMALNEQEAQDIESAAVSAGVNCMVGYSLRFSIGRYVRYLIAAGAVGDIEAVDGSIGIPPAAAARGPHVVVKPGPLATTLVSNGVGPPR